MRVGHQFENNAALAVALDAENDGLIDPFHGVAFTFLPMSGSTGQSELLFVRKLQAHRAIALRIVHPAFAHLDVKKKMHGLLNRRGDLGPRRGADRLDGLAALAEHDLALALAGDIDGLLNADRAVLELLPNFGLNS